MRRKSLHRAVKAIRESLTFYECLQLLSKMVECGMLMRDPNDKNRVLVYRAASGFNSEGWYSENIFDTAQDLFNDIEGQKFLMQELISNKVAMKIESMPIFKYESGILMKKWELKRLDSNVNIHTKDTIWVDIKYLQIVTWVNGNRDESYITEFVSLSQMKDFVRCLYGEEAKEVIFSI